MLYKSKDTPYYETDNLDEVIGSLDILYMTRVQRERFENQEQYEKLKNYYILNKSKMQNAREDMLVMHPLPRVNEIDVDVDDDKRAYILSKLNMECL